MRRRGDDGREMPHEPFDDDAIDALLAGTTPDAGSRALAGFVDGMRAAAEAVPTPSPALAAAIAAGGISTPVAPSSKWKQVSMKIQAALAGMGLAGKIALGVGVAAAATTGAGAAGVLPSPVQHAMARAVDAVSPFSIPDPEHSAGGDGAVAAGDGETTTTTVAGTTPTTEASDNGDHGAIGAGDGATGDTTTTIAAPAGDGGGTVTPTTEASGSHDGGGGTETPSTEPSGSHDGSGDGNGTSTPTTEHHDGGDNPNPQSIVLQCQPDGAAISCSWSASPGADHAQYVLLRVGNDQNRVVFQSADGLAYTDGSVVGGVTYGYRVVSLRADGSVEAHSNYVSVTAPGGSTPTTEHHDGGGDGGATTTTIAGQHD